MFKESGDGVTLLFGAILALITSSFIWLGIEKVWPGFKDQMRMVFLLQLLAFIVFIFLSRNELRKDLLGFLLFLSFLNLTLGINLLGKMRYSLGVVDDDRPIVIGLTITLLLWSGYTGLGHFYEGLRSSLLIFQIFVVAQLLGWLYLTKSITTRETLIDLRHKDPRAPKKTISLTFFILLFLIFGLNETTILILDHSPFSLSQTLLISYLVALFFVAIVKLNRLKDINWLPLFLGLQLFGLPTLGFFLFPGYISIIFALSSQMILLFFGLEHFRLHDPVFNETSIFALTLSGMLIVPSLFFIFGLNPNVFYFIALLIYTLSMINLFMMLHRPDNNISQIDLDSSFKRAEFLSLQIDETEDEIKRSPEISSIFQDMKPDDKVYLKRDNSNNAILYRGKNLELTIHLKNFHSHHDSLIKKLISTIEEYETETDPNNPEKYSRDEIEDLKRRIRADLSDHSYGKGPRFVI